MRAPALEIERPSVGFFYSRIKPAGTPIQHITD
jgi:hypothetical protein